MSVFPNIGSLRGATPDPDLLEGTYDFSSPVYVTLSRFQDYDWKLIANQDIVRYFQVAGEVGRA